MVGGLHKGLVGAVALFALLLCFAGSAHAVAIEPPWCGTPEPDAAGALPDGSSPSAPGRQLPAHPVLRDRLHARRDQGRERRQTDVGRASSASSALGRPMYLVDDQRTRDAAISAAASSAGASSAGARSTTRRKAIADLGGYGDDVKVPIFIQAGIHGNEYEGVDA